MSYVYEKFLKPLKDTDKILRIYDDLESLRYNINPFSIQRVFVVGQNINILLSGNRTIVLDFLTVEEAKSALSKFQNYVDILKNRATPVVDKEVSVFVADSIESSQVVRSINGSTASAQTFSFDGGNNITINLVTTGGLHQITMDLSGVIPLQKGGLGNNSFLQGEILVSGTQSIQSSGYKISDATEDEKTIWTARRIKEQINLVTPFSYKEVPQGPINGVNDVFYLRSLPESESEHIFLNGLLQHENLDYTIDGKRIDFSYPPPQGSLLVCTYRIEETSL